MFVLRCVLVALIVSGPTHGQLTCATLPFPPGDPCIEHNETTQAIYAPLYPSGSTVIVVFKFGNDTRIDVHFDVEIYMDCSGLLIPGGHAQEVYFLQTVELDTQLVTSGVGREILGDNNEILHIRNVSDAIGAAPGSQGEYFCYTCPMDTPNTVGNITMTCDTNASVTVTVLEQPLINQPEIITGPITIGSTQIGQNVFLTFNGMPIVAVRGPEVGQFVTTSITYNMNMITYTNVHTTESGGPLPATMLYMLNGENEDAKKFTGMTATPITDQGVLWTDGNTAFFTTSSPIRATIARFPEPELGPPSNPHLRTHTWGSLYLSWDMPDLRRENITEYRYSCHLTNNESVVVQAQGELMPSVTSAIITGNLVQLTPLTNYTCLVFVSDSKGEGETPAIANGTSASAEPGPPRNPDLRIDTADSLYLSWDRSDEPNMNITEYRYSCHITNNEAAVVQEQAGLMPNVTSAIITGTVVPLTPFTSYTCLVFAGDSLGEGTMPAIAMGKSASAAPTGAPLNFNAISMDPTMLTLSWEEPEESMRNGAIISYSYLCDGVHSVPLVTQEIIAVVTGLMENQQYTCHVGATTVNGTGPSASIMQRTAHGLGTLIIATSVPVTALLCSSCLLGAIAMYFCITKKKTDGLGEEFTMLELRYKN